MMTTEEEASLLRYGELTGWKEECRKAGGQKWFGGYELKELPVDAVWCIALRRENGHIDSRTLEEFGRVGLGPALEFYAVRRPSPEEYLREMTELGYEEDGERREDLPLSGYGCHASHQDLAKLAIRRGYASVLVFEEDAVFDPEFWKQGSWWDTLLSQARERAVSSNYAVVLLGCFPWSVSGILEEFPKVKAVGLHAYVLHPPGMRAFARLDYWRCLEEISTTAAAMRGGIDFWMARNLRCCARLPGIVRQRGGKSSQAEQRSKTLIGKVSNWAMGTRLWQETFFFQRAIESGAYLGRVLHIGLIIFVTIMLAFERRKKDTASAEILHYVLHTLLLQ